MRIRSATTSVSIKLDSSSHLYVLQWNLWITDTLGVGLLSSVQRLYLSRRLLTSHIPQLWGCKVIFEGCDLHEAESAILCRHSKQTKIDRRKDYVLSRHCWVAKCRKIDTILDNFHPRVWSLSAIGGCFVQLLVLCGHAFCPLSGDIVSRRLKMYYFYGKVNRGTWFVHCIEAVCISESPLWEVPLYIWEEGSV